MSDWTIKGQAGQSFPDTLIDVEAMAMQNGSLTFTNQGNDSLSFLLLAEDHTTDPANLPNKDQEISIFRAGVRQFFGYVTSPEYVWSPGQSGWIVRAENGWRELDRVPLTASDKEYVRAQGSLSATITDVINKAIAGGARLQLGSVATMFDIPPIAFRGVNCGAALIELLRIVSDAVAYLDHTGTGFPTINIVRRGAMMTKTITIGTDEIDTCQVTPIPDVTPTKVTVAYATRDAYGVVTEYVQTAGSGTDAQAVILTGNNFADWQAKATAAEVTMRTGSLTPAFADFADLSPVIQKVTTDHGSFTLSPANSTNTRVWTGTASAKSLLSTAFIAPFYSCPTSLTGWYPLCLGDHREWMQKNLGIDAKTGTLEGDWVLWRTWDEDDPEPPLPDWWLALEAEGAVLKRQGFWANGTNGNDLKQTMSYYSPKLTVTFIDVAIASATIYRDSADYGTLAPPTSLAADLLAAQNWLPYRGRLNFTPWQPYERLISKKINLAGTNARLASIGATVQSETINIQTGVQETTLGLPARSGGVALARLKVLGAK
jgi:hypothetical protein